MVWDSSRELSRQLQRVIKDYKGVIKGYKEYLASDEHFFVGCKGSAAQGGQ
jgi:hypothetical protein